MPPTEVPAGQDSLNSFLRKSKGFAGKLGAAAKSAGVYAASQAERTKIVSVTIPALYGKLGKKVYATDALRDRDEFREIIAEIDQLHARAKLLETQHVDSTEEL